MAPLKLAPPPGPKAKPLAPRLPPIRVNDGPPFESAAEPLVRSYEWVQLVASANAATLVNRIAKVKTSFRIAMSLRESQPPGGRKWSTDTPRTAHCVQSTSSAIVHGCWSALTQAFSDYVPGLSDAQLQITSLKGKHVGLTTQNSRRDVDYLSNSWRRGLGTKVEDADTQKRAPGAAFQTTLPS